MTASHQPATSGALAAVGDTPVADGERSVATGAAAPAAGAPAPMGLDTSRRAWPFVAGAVAVLVVIAVAIPLLASGGGTSVAR